MQEAAQVQREIEECDRIIAALNEKRKAAEAKLAEIVRANKAAEQTDRDNFNAAMASLKAFQTWLLELNGKKRSEKLAVDTCASFLVYMQALKIKQKAKPNPNYHLLAKCASLVAELAEAVQTNPNDFETIDKKHQAIERVAHHLEGGRPGRRKLGLVMRSVGAALLVVSLLALVSLVFLPIILPVSTVILIGAGVLAGFILGAHTRSSGKDEINASRRVGLPQQMLLFGDALKDKAHQKEPHKVSVFEDYRRRWFR